MILEEGGVVTVAGDDRDNPLVAIAGAGDVDGSGLATTVGAIAVDRKVVAR